MSRPSLRRLRQRRAARRAADQFVRHFTETEEFKARYRRAWHDLTFHGIALTEVTWSR